MGEVGHPGRVLHHDVIADGEHLDGEVEDGAKHARMVRAPALGEVAVLAPLAFSDPVEGEVDQPVG